MTHLRDNRTKVVSSNHKSHGNIKEFDDLEKGYNSDILHEGTKLKKYGNEKSNDLVCNKGRNNKNFNHGYNDVEFISNLFS